MGARALPPPFFPNSKIFTSGPTSSTDPPPVPGPPRLTAPPPVLLRLLPLISKAFRI
ncbi:hypothetical protein V6Z12_D02G033600 [Gossypium hirsutum]